MALGLLHRSQRRQPRRGLPDRRTRGGRRKSRNNKKLEEVVDEHHHNHHHRTARVIVGVFGVVRKPARPDRYTVVFCEKLQQQKKKKINYI